MAGRRLVHDAAGTGRADLLYKDKVPQSATTFFRPFGQHTQVERGPGGDLAALRHAVVVRRLDLVQDDVEVFRRYYAFERLARFRFGHPTQRLLEVRQRRVRSLRTKQ